MINTCIPGKYAPDNLSNLLKVLFFTLTILFCSIAKIKAQQTSNAALDGEMATCSMKINKVQKKGAGLLKTTGVSYHLTPNQSGAFDPVSNIAPMQKIPIEVIYPEGRSGEKVVIEVLDGGTLDQNKKVKVVTLNSQKKISFNFQLATDPGIYRITLRKGEDLKEVNFWLETGL